MSMMSDFTLGESVVVDSKKLLFVAQAVTGEEQEKNSNAQCVPIADQHRWVYTVVTREDAAFLQEKELSESEIYQHIEQHYQPRLVQAIGQDAFITKKELESVQTQRDINGMILNICKSQMVQATSLYSVLCSRNLHQEAKELDNAYKNPKAMRTRLLLELEFEELYKEHSTKTPFAVVALPYGYRYLGEEMYELMQYPQKAYVALLPQLRLECGVFFDGTLNNMYNTHLRKAYEVYFLQKIEIISGRKQAQETWEAMIYDPAVERKELMPLIFKDLKESLQDALFQKERSVQRYQEWNLFDPESWWRDHLSKESDKVYEFFIQEHVRQGLLKSKQIYTQLTNMSEIEKDKKSLQILEEYQIKQNAYSFIHKSVLDGYGDSYSNDYSNVAKLYKCYSESDDELCNPPFRIRKQRIYISGVGSTSTMEKREHGSDDILDAGLATGEHGVEAKVALAHKALREKIAMLSEQYIPALVLDVFGFSRGAAEARHFVSTLCKELKCIRERKIKKDSNEYIEFELTGTKERNLFFLFTNKEAKQQDSAPFVEKIVFRFIGIFDTVPHVGLIQYNDDEDLNLELNPKKISKVVHLRALDEFRYNFDFFSIKKSEDEKLPSNFEERSLQGAHSDIGGGYTTAPELIELPMEFRRGVSRTHDNSVIRKIKHWNEKHGWLSNGKEVHVEFIHSKDEIIQKNKDGFFIRKYVSRDRHGSAIYDTSRYHIFMYRREVGNEYAQIPLEYMHTQARLYCEMQPLNGLTYKNKGINKEDVLSCDKQYYEEIKPKFLHHSISENIASHGNKPNKHDEFYGERDIHFMR